MTGNTSALPLQDVPGVLPSVAQCPHRDTAGTAATTITRPGRTAVPSSMTTDCAESSILRPNQLQHTVPTVLALPIDEAARAAGISRTRIFEAVRNSEITVRKAGKATLIEIDELRRWIATLPTRGRAAEQAAA